MDIKDGFIVPLLNMVDLQKEKIELYQKEVINLEEQNKFLLEKIRELDINLYNELMK